MSAWLGRTMLEMACNKHWNRFAVSGVLCFLFLSCVCLVSVWPIDALAVTREKAKEELDKCLFHADEKDARGECLGRYAASLNIQETQKLAEQGDVKSQERLGGAYLRGAGVPQDYKKAFQWLKRAAEKGNVDAQRNFGNLYREGKGVSRNYKEALAWFRLAGRNGDALAQHAAGMMYQKGEGVEQHFAKAAQWYRRAAKQGLFLSESALGRLYLLGKGVTQNYSTAFACFRSAAEDRDEEAQYNLAMMYAMGQGVEVNLTLAHMWINLAIAQGERDKSAIDLRNELEQVISPEQVAEAQKLASEWKPLRSSWDQREWSRMLSRISPETMKERSLEVVDTSGYEERCTSLELTTDHQGDSQAAAEGRPTMTPRQELEELRRLDELESKAAQAPNTPRKGSSLAQDQGLAPK